MHEPRTAEDRDTPLSFSMEGSPDQPPSSLITRFWAPRWNSVQSVNKFQTQVGGPLRGGDPGQRLIEPPAQPHGAYFEAVPSAFRPESERWLFVPVHHMFGSEPLSMETPGIARLAPSPYLALNPEDLESLGISEGAAVLIDQGITLSVKVLPALPRGVAAFPVGPAGYMDVRTVRLSSHMGGDKGGNMNNILITILIIICMLLGPLLVAAANIFLERRLLGLWQDRYGPNRVGPVRPAAGLADMIKIFIKEDWIPPFADKPRVRHGAGHHHVATVLLSFAVLPWRPGITVVRSEHRPAVFPGHVVPGCLQRRAGGLVFQQQVLSARRAARRGPDA